MHTPIVEDFAAIRRRMEALRTPLPEVPEPAPGAAVATGPVDFHGWLMGGHPWRSWEDSRHNPGG